MALKFDDLGCTQRERDLFASAVLRLTAGVGIGGGDLRPAAQPANDGAYMLGKVVSLDRSLPLVMCESSTFRAEHDVRLAKQQGLLPAVGDWVVTTLPPGHDCGIILEVLDRKSTFARRDARQHDKMQVLAANVDVALVVHSLSASNMDAHRLERELVCAWECGAVPSLILTKADTCSEAHLQEMLEVAQVIAPGAQVVVESAVTGEGVEVVRQLVPPGVTAVVIGRSGAGKSTLINKLTGTEGQLTSSVRDTDGAGRHTTVSRSMVRIPGGGVIIDAPGIRTMELADAFGGLAAAFPEIDSLEGGCKFRDCKHDGEPGCCVQEAVRNGSVDARRLESYRTLRDEMQELNRKLERTGRASRKKKAGNCKKPHAKRR